MLDSKRSQESRHQEYLQRCKDFHNVLYGLEYGAQDTAIGRFVTRIVNAFNPFDPRKLNNDDLSDPEQLAHLRKYLRDTRMDDPDTTTCSRCPFE